MGLSMLSMFLLTLRWGQYMQYQGRGRGAIIWGHLCVGRWVFLSLNPNDPEMRMDLGTTWCVGDDNWKYFICIKRRERKGIICEAGEGDGSGKRGGVGQVEYPPSTRDTVEVSLVGQFKKMLFSSASFCFQEEPQLEGSSGGLVVERPAPSY